MSYYISLQMKVSPSDFAHMRKSCIVVGSIWSHYLDRQTFKRRKKHMCVRERVAQIVSLLFC